MRSIKVTFDNGNSLETNINGTNAEILKYYVGNEFNLGDGAGGDLMAKATSVEFLDEPAISSARFTRIGKEVGEDDDEETNADGDRYDETDVSGMFPETRDGDISERPSLDAVLEAKTANIPTTVYCSSCGGEFRHHLPTGFSHCEDHKGMHNYDE